MVEWLLTSVYGSFVSKVKLEYFIDALKWKKGKSTS